MNDFLQVLKTRSSTRGYQPERLSNEELSCLIRAGLQAPTAANRQEVHITVIDGANPILKEIEDEKNRLWGRKVPHNFYYEAPHVLILSADTSFHWGDLDAGIAVENISLAAEAMGLGSLIIGCIRDAMQGEKKETFARALHFPEGYEYKIAIALGRKATQKEPHTYSEEANVTYLDIL